MPETWSNTAHEQVSPHIHNGPADGNTGCKRGRAVRACLWRGEEQCVRAGGSHKGMNELLYGYRNRLVRKFDEFF